MLNQHERIVSLRCEQNAFHVDKVYAELRQRRASRGILGIWFRNLHTHVFFSYENAGISFDSFIFVIFYLVKR